MTEDFEERMVAKMRKICYFFAACPGGGRVYAGDLKSPAARHVGSIPTPGTILESSMLRPARGEAR